LFGRPAQRNLPPPLGYPTLIKNTTIHSRERKPLISLIKLIED